MRPAPSIDRDDPGRHAPASADLGDRDRRSTLPDPVPERHQRRSRALRRLGVALLSLVIALGAVNLLGPRIVATSATAGGTTVTVTYAQVTRPGLATPWIVEVRRPGGFDGPVTVTTTADYFDGFDYNVLYPEPSSTASRGERVVFSFEPPPGAVLQVRFDGRATPTWTLVRDAVTTVAGGGIDAVSVSYRTIFLP
jgi:hypothetical protein